MADDYTLKIHSTNPESKLLQHADGRTTWDQVVFTPEIDFEGRKQLRISAGKNFIIVAVSKTGSSIRVFNKNDQEMKVPEPDWPLGKVRTKP